MDDLAPEDLARQIRLRVEAADYLLISASECLFAAGASGLVEEANALIAYPRDPAELATFRSALEVLRAHVLENEETCDLRLTVDTIANDWDETWQRALGPEAITPTFILRPTHCAPAPESESTIWFEPKTAFGSGQHSTTRLAACWIETAVRHQPSLRLFDVGTGSGALSLVAASCGAVNILAVDVDPVAVKAAKHNAHLNNLAHAIEIREGSANATEESFDVVIANINTPILHELAEALVDRVAPGGTLVLTGLLEEDVDDLRSKYSLSGAHLHEEGRQSGWCLLTWTR